MQTPSRLRLKISSQFSVLGSQLRPRIESGQLNTVDARNHPARKHSISNADLFDYLNNLVSLGLALRTENRELRTENWELLMLVRDRALQIDRSQQDENVCLQKRHSDVQPQEHNGNADGHQRKENQRDHIAGKHVGEQTDGER